MRYAPTIYLLSRCPVKPLTILTQDGLYARRCDRPNPHRGSHC